MLILKYYHILLKLSTNNMIFGVFVQKKLGILHLVESSTWDDLPHAPFVGAAGPLHRTKDTGKTVRSCPFFMYPFIC